MIGKMPAITGRVCGLRWPKGTCSATLGKADVHGNEFGQFIEWNFRQSLDWHLLDYEMHRKLRDYVRDLNKLYRSERAMPRGGFQL